MPCWTIQTNTVDLEKINPDVLIDAIQKIADMGRIYHEAGSVVFHVKGQRYSVRDGRIESTANQAKIQKVANDLKVAGATVIVARAAKRFGWNTKQTAANKLVVNRRY